MRCSLVRILCITLWLGALGAKAQAQSAGREAPSSRAEVTLSFAPVVKKAGPAVVNVYGERREQQARHPLLDDPFFRELFGGRLPRERVQQSVGSGVIVGEDGIVVTNHHVIEGMTQVKVSLADRREFEADILLRDPKTDLAVLKIKARETFPALELGDSDALEVGDIVLAVGNPFGVGQTVTQGIISALARTHVDVSDYQFFIQTDAAINPGNSGGALVDVKGQVIGINTAIYSKSGGSHGIGFAVPANMVRVVVASARTGAQKVVRPWYGAKMQPVGAEMVDSLGLDRPVGALVASVVKDSPAAVSGLKAGDVIVAVDGVAIDDPDAFGF
nr:trypsin-like peptidase domain-containing protein [Beijerinckiaceae bacterium]